MSSTTSSDSESCYCSQCNYSFENNHNDYGKLLMNSRHVPMYATMAHPLVYYAEIKQPLNRKQTYDQPRKENPFKKAFKWYTQERTLCNKNEIAPERSGFANWLDNKYVEYLRESGQQPKGPPTSHESRPPKNSTETCPPCPATTKKFGRFKSPWRKRRRPGNDSGDVPEKCPNGSCQFLLKPKEITRAASETCYHTPTSGGKSNSTTSSNMPCNTKCSGRSHSLSDVAREKSALKHGDTVPHAVQECSYCQNETPKQSTIDCTCLQKQGRMKLPKTICVCPEDQGLSKEQDHTTRSKSHHDQKVLSKELNASNQMGPLCPCLKEKASVVKVALKEQDLTSQPTTLSKSPQDQLVKVPSKEQSASNQVGQICTCLQEKVAAVVKVPSKQHDPPNQLNPLQEMVPNVPSKAQDLTNQEPCCKSNLDKVPKVVQVPSKEQDPPTQVLQGKVPKVPSKVQDPMNQQPPCCKSNLDKVPKEEQVLRKEQAQTNQQKPPQVKLPKVPLNPQDSTSHLGPCCKSNLDKAPKVVQVPSKEQDSTNQRTLSPEKVPKVPSAAQDPTNQLGPCCKSNVEKVPKIVQVPSQSRAVEESSQYPEEKVVPVNEETQYEPTPESTRSTQNLGPCSCKTCKKPMPPPPPQAQSNKIVRPEISLTIAPTQIDAPKKQRARRLSISCQGGEGSKSKVDTRSQHQAEPSACCKDTTPNQNNCHEVNQVYGPISIRRQSYSAVAINEETGEYTLVKEVSVVNKFTRSVTYASNDAAQTSDHSIHFEKGACNGQYPLFFKVFYADIPKNE